MINKTIFEQVESKVRSYSRAYPCTFDKAINAEMWDVDGRSYIDFLAGCGSLNYGHNNPVLKEALIDYISADSVALGLDMQTAAKERFLQSMQDYILAPRKLDYVVQFTGPTGTNAVEAALKLARKVTGRTNVVFFTNGFHGVSSGALAVTGNQYHRGAAGLPLQGGTPMPYDGYFGKDVDTIVYLERMIKDKSSGVDLPAAVIVETVQGEGGLNVASDDWLRRLSVFCKQNDILLIVDDIQAGCGRTGSFFSFESAGITPDIVTLSKSLSGYGLPFSVVLLRREIDDWKPAEHNGTFRGNNHAFVTAAKALEQFWQTDEFSNGLKAKIELLDNRLNALHSKFSPDLTEVRGRGMMRGLVCADASSAAAITADAFTRGLIIERSGADDEVIKFLLPLTISEADMQRGLDILECSIAQEFSMAEAVNAV